MRTSEYNELGAPFDMPDGLTEEQIRRQLERIVRSEIFSASPKLCSLLNYIVGRTLEGNEKRIKQYSIATEALGLGEDFDPNTSPAVRLDAGRLRTALKTYYSDNPEETVRISVPKGRYIPVFEAITHDTVEARSHGDAETLNAFSRPDLLEPNRLLIVRLFTHAHSQELLSIAESLTDQLIVEFAGYPDISIATTTELPDDKWAGLQSVGVSHRARFVLCGTVKSSNLVHRITFQLHDIRSKTVIWASKYEYNDSSNTAFEAQDEVAGQVAGTIADDFGIMAYRRELEREQSPGGAATAHNALLFHRHLTRTLTHDAYRLAREKVEESLQQQPANSSLWAAIAQTVFYGNVLGYGEDENWTDRVRYSAQRSLELDRNNHYAQVAMAQYSLFQRDFDSVFELADRVLAKNPRSASNQLSAGYFRAVAGNWDDGVGLIKQALGRLHNPPSWAYKVLYLNAYRQEDYDEARRQINLYYVPEHFTPPLLRAAVMMRLGRRRDADVAADEVRRIKPDLKDHLDNYLRYLSAFDDLTDRLRQPLYELGLI